MFPTGATRAVAFINPPGPAKLYRSIICTYISKANYIWQPQDFINLSAQIPPEYDLKLFDCSLNGIDAERLFENMTRYNPGVAVIALSSIVFDHDLEFLRQFRRHFPEIICLALGDILLEEVFWEKVCAYVDGLVLNSLDLDFAAFLRTGESHSAGLLLKNGKFQRSAPALKPKKVSIGIPRHQLFLNRKYRFPFVKSYLYSTVSTQFSCPYRCKYCSASKIPVTYRDYQEVLAELELIRQLGVHDLFFADPSFGFPKDNARHILEGMLSQRLGMRWVCYTNPALWNKETLKLMQAAGCHTVIIGVDDEDTDLLKEKYGRTLSKSTLIAFCEECRRLQIHVCGDFIIGLNSNEAAVKRLVQFAQTLRLDYASFNIFTVLLGSMVREELVREGKFDPYTLGYDTSGTFGVSDARLVRLRNLAVRKFYLRPGYLLHRVMAIRSLPELRIHCEEMLTMLKNVFQSRRKK